MMPAVERENGFRRRLGRPFRLGLKLGVILLCFLVLARRVDLRALVDAFQGLQGRWLVPAALAVWFEPVIAALKWRLLMAAHLDRRAPPLGVTLRVVFTANFLSLLAPTALSADALRLWLLRQRGYGVIQGAGAMLADRALGLATLLVLTLAGWWHARLYLPAAAARLIPLVCLAGLAAIAAAFLPVWLSLFRLLERLPVLSATRFEVWRRKAERLLDGFQAYRHQFRPMLQAGLWNLLIQFLRVLQIFFLFRALGYAVPLVDTLTFVPVIVLLSMLPVSFYGVGIKEGAFVFLFAQVGLPREISLSVSLLTYPLILSALLPGLLFFLAGRETLPKPERPLQP